MGGLTAQEQQQAASEAMGRALQRVGCLQGWFMETLRLPSAPVPPVPVTQVPAPPASPSLGKLYQPLTSLCACCGLGFVPLRTGWRKSWGSD